MPDVTLEIERLNPFALGIAFHEGLRYLVPFVLPGETVAARPMVRRKSGVLCELLRVEKTSRDRVEPPCHYYGTCGGCDLQHMSYVAEIRFKEAWIKNQFSSFENADVRPLLVSPLEYRYRNRITLHAGDGNWGYYRRGSHEVVAVDECPIASDTLNKKLKSLPEVSVDGGNLELREDDSVSFLQINTGINEHLLNAVRGFATGHKTQRVLELYAGQGNLSFMLTEMAREVVAVEGNSDAVARAEKRRCELENKKVRFLREDVFQVVYGFREGYEKFDLIVCDPPRGGLANVLDVLASLGARKIIYVSCDPHMLVKDLHSLGPFGYGAKTIQPLDMFPKTHHIEVVAEIMKDG